MATFAVDLVWAVLPWAHLFLPLFLQHLQIGASHAGVLGLETNKQESQRVQSLSKSAGCDLYRRYCMEICANIPG